MNLRITKVELELISTISDINQGYFAVEEVNSEEVFLVFPNEDAALDFDELIKEELVSRGFDLYYNSNQFGKMCNKVISKLYKVLGWREA